MAEIPTGFVRFQVNGKIYDISIENLKKCESTLSNMVQDVKSDEPIVIDEDSQIFKAILSYHRTGGLIAKPPTIADDLWDDRIKYWGLNMPTQQTNNYYMLDYVLYFGQRYIKQYNRQEQTILWSFNGHKRYLNVSNMRFDGCCPFLISTGEVYMFVGYCLYQFIVMNCKNSNEKSINYNDDFSKCKIITLCKKDKIDVKTKLKQAINVLLENCKRNDKIETSFWSSPIFNV